MNAFAATLEGVDLAVGAAYAPAKASVALALLCGYLSSNGGIVLQARARRVPRDRRRSGGWVCRCVQTVRVGALTCAAAAQELVALREARWSFSAPPASERSEEGQVTPLAPGAWPAELMTTARVSLLLSCVYWAATDPHGVVGPAISRFGVEAPNVSREQVRASSVGLRASLPVFLSACLCVCACVRVSVCARGLVARAAHVRRGLTRRRRLHRRNSPLPCSRSRSRRPGGG